MAQELHQISHTQSRILARAIYKDITAYIVAHQEEYQKFLKPEEKDYDENN